MPGKSRHGKGKYSFQSKRKKGKQHFEAKAIQQQAVAQASKPVTSPGLVTPSASRPTPKTALTTARYPYITAELRRIIILGGIMLVILIVLALVLS